MDGGDAGHGWLLVMAGDGEGAVAAMIWRHVRVRHWARPDRVARDPTDGAFAGRRYDPAS